MKARQWRVRFYTREVVDDIMSEESEEKIENVDEFYEGDDQWYDIDEFVEGDEDQDDVEE